MDGTRFDALARGFARRLTRRNTLKGGVGFAALMAGAKRANVAAAAGNAALRRYSSVRMYSSDAAASEVKTALAALLPQLQAVPGFIDFSVVNAAGNQVVTIAVFSTADGLTQAGQLETQWIADNAMAMEAVGKGVGGPVILRAATGAGCPCTIGVDNTCDSDALVCCANAGDASSAGTCVDAAIGCGEAVCKAPGDPCQMIPDHGCCPGYTCFEGICDNPRGCFGPGDPCTGDGDCCEGSCSDSGICFCTEPDRPQIGCSCESGSVAACGGRPELCCAGVCISPMAECSPPAECGAAGSPCTIGSDTCCPGFTCFEGICDNPKGCVGPGETCGDASDCCQGDCSPSGVCFCTDPDRPDIGCACDPGDPNACGGSPQRCCVNQCISPMANC